VVDTDPRADINSTIAIIIATKNILLSYNSEIVSKMYALSTV